MPAGQWSYQNFAAANQATANAAETVIATTKAVNSPFNGAQFGIEFSVLFTVGAGTTAVVFRIRQTSLTGTVVLGPDTTTLAATNVLRVTLCVVDGSLAESTGAVWVLTAAQTGGTAPGGATDSWSCVTTPV